MNVRCFLGNETYAKLTTYAPVGRKLTNYETYGVSHDAAPIANNGAPP